jgi:hypothetical protein
VAVRVYWWRVARIRIVIMRAVSIGVMRSIVRTLAVVRRIVVRASTRLTGGLTIAPSMVPVASGVMLLITRLVATCFGAIRFISVFRCNSH